MSPRHVNPETPERTATAPYNYVPLPSQVFVVADGIDADGKKVQPWKRHDQFVHGTCSGWIDLSIRTLTPLFVRGPATETNGSWDERDARLRPEPLVAPDGRPVIPGSSLRGMIRTLVEILSFSKIQPVTKEKPFFRSMAADRIGSAYRERMARGDKKPEGGFVKKEGNQWFIVPAKEVLKVHHDDLKAFLSVPSRPHPSYTPDWKAQHKPCWFKRDSTRRLQVFLEKKNGCEEGTLVLTGSAPKKQHEFVFVGEDASQKKPIPDEVWQRFHDDDQITQWQEKAFPADQPTDCSSPRPAKGHLRDGEPVFFLTNADSGEIKILFLGRAQMFRLPYDLSPADLIPEDAKNAGIDMAEALFGKVGQEKGEQEQAIKGRLCFEDAIAIEGGPNWLEDVLVPSILSSPQVASFQHCLTQDGTKEAKQLTTYLQNDRTSMRGHKLYWHRWDDGRGLAAVKEAKDYDRLLEEMLSGNPNDTQHTIIRPVRADVVFQGRIRFDNLTDLELGALLSALQLPEGCAHKLGMGKPLGLGSVRIQSTLHVVDWKKRYSSWDEKGETKVEGKAFLAEFEQKMLAHARQSGEAVDDRMARLQKIGRLQVLFHLLTWEGRPTLEETRCMDLEQFKRRPILPTPHKVVKKTEPSWKPDPPRPFGAQREAESIVPCVACPMSDSLNKLTIRGFKSIKELEDFELKNLNIFVGANGSGKSNLISFFRMLQSLISGTLVDYIRNSGGISDLLYNGRNETKQMKFETRFGARGYRFAITPSLGEGFALIDEGRCCQHGNTGWRELGSSSDNSSKLTKEAKSTSRDSQCSKPIYQVVSSWKIYQFHNTSATAAMRHAEIVEDNKSFRNDASNIGPFLLRLRNEKKNYYDEILDSCRMVAPFLDAFLLDPQQLGPKTKVSLTWKTKGSDYPMQPYHLSDGSIRFICLATALLQPDPPSTIIIDEPELGLHPEAIRILGELIEDAAKRTQIIIATQSPLLLDQFSIEDIVVVSRQDGQSTFERLKHSNFNEWLEDYSVGELWTKNVIQGGPTNV